MTIGRERVEGNGQEFLGSGGARRARDPEDPAHIVALAGGVTSLLSHETALVYP